VVYARLRSYRTSPAEETILRLRTTTYGTRRGPRTEGWATASAVRAARPSTRPVFVRYELRMSGSRFADGMSVTGVCHCEIEFGRGPSRRLLTATSPHARVSRRHVTHHISEINKWTGVARASRGGESGRSVLRRSAAFVRSRVLTERTSRNAHRPPIYA
jgi:hypothetical protein